MTPLQRLRLERAARRLHQLGARPLCELLNELADRGDPEFVLARLAAYERLDPATLGLLGGDCFPPRLSIVPEAP